MATNFYLGIDVSKGYADFTILNQKKEVVENLEEKLTRDNTTRCFLLYVFIFSQHVLKYITTTKIMIVEAIFVL